MARVRTGDRAAYRELYEKHFGAIVRYAMGFTGNRARAEELGQEVFLQVYRARDRWEPRARFTTWLYTIAHNACLNEVRRFGYRGRIDSLDRPGGAPTEIEDPRAVSADESVSVEELRGRLRELIAELPDAQRSALVLSRREGMVYEEVARVLGCTEQAVKSLIFRATRHLKEGLKAWVQDER